MKTRHYIEAAFLAAITAMLSLISIPTGVSAVPFSLGIIAVFLSGIILDPVPALFSQIIYLLLGLAGLPVFSQFQAGFSVFAGPTGGYLLAYPVMAYIAALFLKKTKKRNIPFLITAMYIALGICYTAGCLWLALTTGIPVSMAFLTGAVPFIIPDSVKIIATAFIGRAMLRALHRHFPDYH